MNDRAYQIVFDAMCCIMFADGNASKVERVKARELMRRVGASWTEEEVDRRITEFFAAAKAKGLRQAVDTACENLKAVRGSVNQKAFLKVLDEVIAADSVKHKQETAVRELFVNALSTNCDPTLGQPVTSSGIAKTKRTTKLTETSSIDRSYESRRAVETDKDLLTDQLPSKEESRKKRQAAIRERQREVRETTQERKDSVKDGFLADLDDAVAQASDAKKYPVSPPAKQEKMPAENAPQVSDPEDLFSGDNLDAAIAISRDVEGYNVALLEHQERNRGSSERSTEAKCPQCQASVNPAVNSCPSCHLSFRQGYCAVCGAPAPSANGQRECKHNEARIVVWDKSVKRGLCTNCGEATVQTGGLFDKQLDCVRCTVDFELQDVPQYKLGDSKVASPVSKTPRSRDQLRIRLLRKKIERMKENAERLKKRADASEEKGSFLGAAAKTILVSSVVGRTVYLPPGTTRDAEADERAAKAQSRMFVLQCLLNRMHRITDNQYANSSEKWWQRGAKVAGFGCLGLVVAALAILILIVAKVVK